MRTLAHGGTGRCVDVGRIPEEFVDPPGGSRGCDVRPLRDGAAASARTSHGCICAFSSTLRTTAFSRGASQKPGRPIRHVRLLRWRPPRGGPDRGKGDAARPYQSSWWSPRAAPTPGKTVRHARQSAVHAGNRRPSVAPSARRYSPTTPMSAARRSSLKKTGLYERTARMTLPEASSVLHGRGLDSLPPFEQGIRRDAETCPATGGRHSP